MSLDFGFDFSKSPNTKVAAKTSVNAAGMTIVEFQPLVEELSIPIDNGAFLFTLGAAASVVGFAVIVLSFFF